MGKYNMKAVKTVLQMACDECNGYCVNCPITDLGYALPCEDIIKSHTFEAVNVLAKWLKNKGMKKSDLKDGMICKTREGEIFIWLNGELRGRDCWCSGTLEDLTNEREEGCDIVKIYIADAPTLEDMLNVKGDTHVYIWEREATKKMTLEEVKKALGYKVEIMDLADEQVTADDVNKVVDMLEHIQDEYYKLYHDKHVDAKYNEGRADAMETAIRIVRGNFIK